MTIVIKRGIFVWILDFRMVALAGAEVSGRGEDGGYEMRKVLYLHGHLFVIYAIFLFFFLVMNQSVR